MVTHPEYDDRFYRFVKNIRVRSLSGEGMVTRIDSAVWKISVPGKDPTITYDIVLPPKGESSRPAWQPFLKANGGLVGDLHSFMYIEGMPFKGSVVDLDLPAGWQAASALSQGKGRFQFIARSGEQLADAPILIGKFLTKTFYVDNIPHRVSYLPTKEIKFDVAAASSQIKKLVYQCRDLFGKLPYPSYDFLLHDEAYGGLEHADCVTLGLNIEHLKNNPSDLLSELAHEYFHS